MLPKKLLIILITCIVVCHGNLDENFISRIKRLHGDNESNSEGNTESVKNDGPKSRNEELINLRIGDVTRPLSQHIPKLSNIKNIIPSSLPLPVELLLTDDQNQHSELNSKSIDKVQDKEEPGKVLDNKVDSVKLSTVKRRPTKKKITKTTNNNEIMEGNISRRTQARNKIEINPHNLVLENKLNNKNLDSEKIISPENYNKEHLFDEAIIPLLKILGNSLKSNELDIPNSNNQQNTSEKKRKIQKLSSNLDDTRDLDTDVLSAEKVTKILEEQNNLLKNLLFKTLNYKNETNSDNDEKETKKIHLILDINSDAKDNENPNTIQNRNNYEKILNMILYRDRNTQNSSGDDKKENKVEELPNNLRNDTNQYVYFNNRNIKTYIYSTNTKQNQPTRYNPKQYPVTGIDWKRYNMRSNQKLNNIRIIFIPSHEEQINHNYKLYKKLKSNQQIQNSLQGINLDHKSTIFKCPYHGLYSRL